MHLCKKLKSLYNKLYFYSRYKFINGFIWSQLDCCNIYFINKRTIMIRLAHEWYDLERKNIYDELWGWGYKLDEFMMKNNIFMFDPYIFYFYEELWKLRKSSI